MKRRAPRRAPERRPPERRATSDRAKADLFKALSGETRLALLEALAKGELTAGALAKRVRIGPSTASNALAMLLGAGLVEVERVGRERVYKLRHPELSRFLARADAMAALVDVTRRR